MPARPDTLGAASGSFIEPSDDPFAAIRVATDMQYPATGFCLPATVTLVESEPPRPSDPEQLLKGYPWPSSRLTKGDMIRLSELRTKERKPITTLLHDAVIAYHKLLTDPNPSH